MTTYHAASGTPADPTQGRSIYLVNGMQRGCCDCPPPTGERVIHRRSYSLDKRGFKGFLTNKRYRRAEYSLETEDNAHITDDGTDPNYTYVYTRVSTSTASAEAVLVDDYGGLGGSGGGAGICLFTSSSYSSSYSTYEQTINRYPWEQRDEFGNLIGSGVHVVTTTETITEDRSGTGELLEGYSLTGTVNATGEWRRVKSIVHSGTTSSGSLPPDEHEDVTSPSTYTYTPSTWRMTTVNDTKMEYYEEGSRGDFVRETVNLLNEYTDAELEQNVADRLGDLSWIDPDGTELLEDYLQQVAVVSPLYRASYATQLAFTNAIAARVATATTARNNAQNLVTSAEASLLSAEATQTTRAAAVADYETQLSTEISNANTLRAAWGDLRQEYYALYHQWRYDTSLTPAERAALQTQYTTVNTQMQAAQTAYLQKENQTVSIRNALLSSKMQLQDAKAEVLSRRYTLILRNYFLEQAENRLAATENNEFVTYCTSGGVGYDMNLVSTHSPTKTGDDLTSLGRSIGNYRWHLRGDGGFMTRYVNAAPLTYNLSWNLRKAQEVGRASGVSEEDTAENTPTDTQITTTAGVLEACSPWVFVEELRYGYYVRVQGRKDIVSVNLWEQGLGFGGMQYKRGWLGFSDTVIPSIYRRLDWSGGSAGCSEPDSDEDAKTYSGRRQYEEAGGVTTPIPLSAETNVALSTGWPGQGARPPEYENAGNGTSRGVAPARELPEPTLNTETVREWVRVFKCGSNDVEDTLRATLSQEFTTARMRQLVDDAYDADERHGLVSYGTWGGVMRNPLLSAVWWMSPDETMYRRVKRVFQIRVLYGTYDLYDRTVSVNITWRKLNLTTGVLSEEIREYSVTIPSGDSVGFYEVGGVRDILMEAGEGELVWIEADDVQTLYHPTNRHWEAEVTLVEDE